MFFMHRVAFRIYNILTYQKKKSNLEEKVKNSGNNFNLKRYRGIITKFFSLQNRKLLTTPVKKPQHLEIERSGSNLKNDA